VALYRRKLSKPELDYCFKFRFQPLKVMQFLPFLPSHDTDFVIQGARTVLSFTFYGKMTIVPLSEFE